MADPQKLKQLVSEAVSVRVQEMQKSLIDEITASLQQAVSAAEEQAAAAEAKVEAAEQKAAAAEQRAQEAEEALAERSKPMATAGGSPTDLLGAGVATISDANSQGDILRALLDGIAQFTARSALYVIKGGQLNGWQSRGFANEGAIKGSTMDPGDGLAHRALQDKEPVSAAAAEFNEKFISQHGNPVDGNATVLPLVVRDKVSALIYVDAGTATPGHADISAVKVLTASAAMWLEILALRKIAGGTAAEDLPAPMAAAAAAAPAPVESVAERASAAVAPAAAPPVASSPAAGGPDLSGLSAADQEAHKKAKRFAKLLVDEIKLYNQAKVTEGKKSKDLYARLKEDIDKSRQTYEKRWGSSAAASGDYFQAELVRILADGDASLLGD